MKLKNLILLGITAIVITLGYLLFFSKDPKKQDGTGTFSGSSGSFFRKSDKEKLKIQGEENYKKANQILEQNINNNNSSIETNNITINSKTENKLPNKTNKNIQNSENYNFNNSINNVSENIIIEKKIQNSEFNINSENNNGINNNVSNNNQDSNNQNTQIKRKKLSSPIDITQTTLYQECLTLIKPLLSTTPPNTDIQTTLNKLSGFNLLLPSTQTTLINNIQTKKYGTNPEPYCKEIISAITSVIQTLEIYNESQTTLSSLPSNSTPSQTQKNLSSNVTGFNLLLPSTQTTLITSIGQKNTPTSSIDITSSIIKPLQSTTISNTVTNTISSLISSNTTSASETKTTLIKNITNFTQLPPTDQNSSISNIITQKYETNPYRPSIDLTTNILQLSSPIDITQTTLYQECLTLIKPLLSTTPPNTDIQTTLNKLSGFNLLLPSTQTTLINNIQTKKYGTNPEPYCKEIISAITSVIQTLEIYNESQTTLSSLPSNSTPSQTQKNLSSNVTGFNLLLPSTQTTLITSIGQKNTPTSSIDITSSIIKPLQSTTISNTVTNTISSLISSNTTSASETKTTLIKNITNFTQLPPTDQNSSISNIITQKYETNPYRPSIDLTTNILQLSSPIDITQTTLYQECLTLIKPLLSTTPPNTDIQTTLNKLSGFNLLLPSTQTTLINNIQTKKYGTNPEPYCKEIISAITSVIQTLEIYNESQTTLSSLPSNSTPSQTQKNLSSNVTGFNLLLPSTQTTLITSIGQKNTPTSSIDITSSIIKPLQSTTISNTVTNTISSLISSNTTSASETKTTLIKNITNFTQLPPTDQNSSISNIITQKYETNPYRPSIDLTTNILQLSSPIDITQTTLYQECLTLIKPLLSTTPPNTDIQTTLNKLSGFNLLLPSTQTTLINNIQTKKYGTNPEPYCKEIISAITSVIQTLEIYNESQTTLSSLPSNSTPSQTQKNLSSNVTGFNLLLPSTQTTLITSIGQKNTPTSSIDITSSIIKPLQSTTISNTVTNTISSLISSNTTSASETKTTLIKNITNFTQLPPTDQNSSISNIITQKYETNPYRPSIDLTTNILQLSSPIDITQTTLYQECLTLIKPLLSTTPPNTDIQTTLNKLSGFNLLLPSTQTTLINNIQTKKYGTNPEPYCKEIISAITSVIQTLEIYNECLSIVSTILNTTLNPTITYIKAQLIQIPIFEKLSQDKQNQIISDIQTKKYENNAQMYCINIISNIVDAIQSLDLYKQCIQNYQQMPINLQSQSTIKLSLQYLSGFTLIDEKTQNEIISSIYNKQYGNNAQMYCMQIVDAIIAKLDPADLYQQCITALKEILKEKTLISNTVSENTILTKLSLMGIFNGVFDVQQMKVIATKYLGKDYPQLIYDIQNINNFNFEQKSQQICSKISSSIVDNIINENTYGDCVTKINSIQNKKIEDIKIVDILPDTQYFTQEAYNEIEKMIKSFIAKSNITAKDICTYYFEKSITNTLNSSTTKNNNSNSSNSSNSSENDKTLSSAPNACTYLVDIVDTEYQNSVINGNTNAITNIQNKIPAFEYYIPEQLKSKVIEQTIVTYLSRPVIDDNGATIHRDTSLQMSDDMMSLFTNFSSTEKNKIASRLYDIYQKSGRKSIDNTITNAYPYICKCSHPDFDDVKWNDAITEYFNNQNITTTTLSNNPTERITQITTSSFYTKCSNTVKMLSNNDNTTENITTKMVTNLPDLKNLKMSLSDYNLLTCYSTVCYGKSSCSQICQKNINSFCESTTEKYLTTIPQQKPKTISEIFQCIPNQSQSSYNIVKLQCKEVGISHYTTTDNREKFTSHCYDSIMSILSNYQRNPSQITKSIIQSYLIKNNIYSNLTQNEQDLIISDLYNKIQVGNISYNKGIETSCYNTTDVQKQNLGQHFNIGMQYFTEDAQTVRDEIINKLWEKNSSRRLMENRRIYSDSCVKISQEYWSRFLSKASVREGQKNDISLPPSGQCKCFIDNIYSNLNERAVTSDTDCNVIITDTKNTLMKMRASAQSSNVGMPTSTVLSTLSTISNFGDRPYNERGEIAQKISNNLASNRFNQPSSSITDTQIILNSTQKQEICTKISSYINLSQQNMDKCLYTIGTITYAQSKQPEVTPSNLVCNMLAESIDKIIDDNGQIDFFPSQDVQYKDIRLSTCTQKLRATYNQILQIKSTYWQPNENWTFNRNTQQPIDCTKVPNYILDLQTMSNLEQI